MVETNSSIIKVMRTLFFYTSKSVAKKVYKKPDTRKPILKTDDTSTIVRYYINRLTVGTR